MVREIKLNMEYRPLVESVKSYVLNYFNEHAVNQMIYHNAEHTKEVVIAATRMADHYQLNDKDYFAVITAAWFHDVGYIYNKKDHEASSALLASDFLATLEVNDELTDQIRKCIFATRMPQKPEGLLEQIICDADLFHLGTDDFTAKSKKLRKEVEALRQIDIDKEIWREDNIKLLRTHIFFTDYARFLLSDKQSQNLAALQNKEKVLRDDLAVTSRSDNSGKDDILADVGMQQHSGKVKKPEKPEKGIETMFRITSGNNQRLSDMADNKAHILITVNSIILSAIISLVLRKLDDSAFLAIPSFVLLTVSLLSITFAILATRPAIPDGKFVQSEIDQKTVNLLFFGNFYKMGLKEYAEGMLKVMGDSDFLYGTLIKDVYSQGAVLGRKYRFLRVAYNIFMFGLIISVISFIIASVLHDMTPAPLMKPATAS